VQIEAPDHWLMNEDPWEFRRDARKVIVKFRGKLVAGKNIHDEVIYSLENGEEVGALPYDMPIVGYDKNSKNSIVTLRLWTTKESPRNFQLQRYNAGRLDEASENTTLTDVLYPSDNNEMGKRVRLKQEFLLVSASLQDIVRHYLGTHDNFRAFSDKVRIQINDTHPSLIIPELIRVLNSDFDIPWKMALEMTIACTGYTNHTILKEALEEWDQSLMNYLLPRQSKVIERLNQEFCNKVRQKYPDDENRVRRMSIIEEGRIRMANLAIVGSHRINGVAELHSEILKQSVFSDFYDLYPERFLNVTNGVTQRRWLLSCNPDLSKFITKRIGEGWITDFTQIKKLAEFADDPFSIDEFLAVKKRNKYRLIDFLNQENKLRDSQGIIVAPCPIIDPDSLFDVQIKRIHEYKRQLMNALHIVMLYQELLANPHKKITKRTFLFAGKAAAGYETAKDIIRFIHCMARKINRDPRANPFMKVIYVENYNVSHAEMLIPAADLSEQISTASTEASGTGNMKLTINGALTIGTNDGANIEMRQEIGDEWWPFAFGCSADEIFKFKTENSYDPKGIYDSDPQIRQAVDTLRDRTFALNDEEHQAFSDLFHKLIEMHYGESPDRYFILKDLRNYYDTQKKVDTLYNDPVVWAKYCLHNIAGMGKFSTDYSIKNYCEKIWGLSPCLIDDEIHDVVENEYREHDRCRIYTSKTDK
jgi:glycogen phosphorylase